MCSSCCYSCLKAMVFIVNLLVMLVGMVVTGLAVWLLVSEHLYLSSSWEDFSLVTCAVLSVGLLISLLAFLACCGAITRSKCLLGMFVISLLALLVGEVSLVVLVYFKELDYRPLLREGVHEIVTEKYHPNNTATVLYWDTIQQGFECCGSSGPIDWAHSIYNGYQENTKEIGIGAKQAVLPFTIPSSCCRNLDDPLCSSTITPKFKTIIDENIYYSEGCLRKTINFISSNSFYLIIAASIIICIEMLGIIFSTCLCCAIKKIEDLKP
eukprot:TRINITY_DN15634_c0_g1_i3.p1 TRINITY_DN15634_c0_g1~~TRINITY_DN15634_c0_g1_i3.p1  ORF type:complete len:268 (+),score=64.84 TRINITY_DN15634_c0_g1_i3:347-1150(+)